MSQIRRFWFALMMTLGIAASLIVYFRVVVDELQPMVNGEFSGPLTAQANLAIFITPVALSIMLVAVWYWVIISPKQEETKRARIKRPPR